MAEKGLTIPQMKAISGHNSDTVLQQYIDQSDKLKSVGENALAIGNTEKIHFTTPAHVCYQKGNLQKPRYHARPRMLPQK